MKEITSKNNPIIVETSKLKLLKHRKEKGRFLIEGVKVIEVALGSYHTISRLFIDEENINKYENTVNKAISSGIEVISISSQVAAKLAHGSTTQGIFAIAKIKTYDIDEVSEQLVIACEDIRDPGNMGTIIRTADCVGIKSIIISDECVDIYNDKVIRASMGSVFNVNTISSKRFIEDLSDLKTRGYNVACGHLDGEDFFGRVKHEKNVLIIGNEARGISDELASVCQEKWKIPIKGKAESLNAAIAAGIMMYDLMRSK